MNIETVIFDLDGTLLNTIEDLADSMNQVLKAHSFEEHKTEAYNYFVGNGARKLVERALPEHVRDSDTIDQYLKEYRSEYENNWHNKTDLYPGIEDLLLKLRELRIPMAILSNKPHSDVLNVTAHFFDDTMFSAISGQRDHIPHKPAPDGVFVILEELKVLPDNCLFVGDSSVDMQTAKNSGMKAVGVTWGFRQVEELLENGADHIIKDPWSFSPFYRQD